MRDTMHRIIPIVLLFAGMALTHPAYGEESEKVRKARYENELEKEMDRVNEKCGTKAEVVIDWPSFDAAPEWNKYSVSGYCDSVLGALRRFCDGEHARAYLKKALEVVTCHAAKDKAAWRVVYKKGHLHWHVPTDAVNADTFAHAQLLRTL